MTESWRRELAQRRRVRERARALEDRVPENDLWPGIARRIGAGDRSGRRGSRVAAAAALVLCGLALGVGLGAIVFGDRGSVPAAGTRFLLLLHEPVEMQQPRTTAESRALVDRFRRWSRELAARGKLVLAEKLGEGEGFRLRADAPDEERTERHGISGFFVLRADSYDEARRLARTCPILALGGRVELRRIEET